MASSHGASSFLGGLNYISRGSAGGKNTRGFWVRKPRWMASSQQMASCCMHEKLMVKVMCCLKVPAIHYLLCIITYVWAITFLM